MTLYFSWAYCSQPFWPVISVLLTQICTLVSEVADELFDTARPIYWVCESFEFCWGGRTMNLWELLNYYWIFEFLNCYWITEILNMNFYAWISRILNFEMFYYWDYYERPSFCYCNRRSCFEVRVTRFEVTKAGLRPWVGQLLLQTSLTTLPLS